MRAGFKVSGTESSSLEYQARFFFAVENNYLQQYFLLWRIQISLWHIWFPSTGCQLSLWIPHQIFGYLPLQFPAIRFVHLIRPRLSLQVCVPAPWLFQSVLIEMCHFDDSSAGMSADRCSIISRCSVLGYRVCKRMFLQAISLLHRIIWNPMVIEDHKIEICYAW